MGECRLHASEHGSDASSIKEEGEGPTVEIVTLEAEKPILEGSDRAREASDTPCRFMPASPIPMNTTFLQGDIPVEEAIAMDWITWLIISEPVRERIIPIFAVAQKRQPRSQPTWVETHTVVRLGEGEEGVGRVRGERGCVCAFGGVRHRSLLPPLPPLLTRVSGSV